MGVKRNALGRGLDSLISMGEIQTGGSSAINEIPTDLIQPNPEQPRLTFDEETIGELADSIKEIGIVQPLTLRDNGDGTYRIIAGERRWRASKLAGLERVPAYIRKATDSEITEMALIENIQREDLNAIEVALAFRKLIESYDLTQERLAERLGKKRASIANHLRLLKLPAEIQLGLRDGKVDMGHARALLGVGDAKRQLKLYNLIIKNGLSVRRVEEMVRKLNEEQIEISEEEKVSKARCKALSEDLSSFFSVPVRMTRREDGRGSITFSFSNDNELQSLLQHFNQLNEDQSEGPQEL